MDNYKNEGMAGDFCNMEIEDNDSFYSPAFNHRQYQNNIKPINVNLNSRDQSSIRGYFTVEGMRNANKKDVPEEVITIDDGDETMEVPSETPCQLSGRKLDTCSVDTCSMTKQVISEEIEDIINKLNPNEVSVSMVYQKILQKNQMAMAVIPTQEGQSQITDNSTLQTTEKNEARDLHLPSMTTASRNTIPPPASNLSESTSGAISLSNASESTAPSQLLDFSECRKITSSLATNNNFFQTQMSLIDYITRYSQHHQLFILPFCNMLPTSSQTNPSTETSQTSQNLQETSTVPSTSAPQSNVSATNSETNSSQQKLPLTNSFSISQSSENYQAFLRKKKRDQEVFLEKWNTSKSNCNKIFDAISKYFSKSEHKITHKPVFENDKDIHTKNDKLKNKNDGENSFENDDLNNMPHIKDNNDKNKIPTNLKSVTFNKKVKTSDSNQEIIKRCNKQDTNKIKNNSKNRKKTEEKTHKTSKTEENSKNKRNFHEALQFDKNKDYESKKRKTSNMIPENVTCTIHSKELRPERNEDDKLVQDNGKLSGITKIVTKITHVESKQKLLNSLKAPKKSNEIITKVSENKEVTNFTSKEPTINRKKYMSLDPRLKNKQNNTNSNLNLNTDSLELNLSKDSQKALIPTTLTTTEHFKNRDLHESHDRNNFDLKKITPSNCLNTPNLGLKQQSMKQLLSNNGIITPENTRRSKTNTQVREKGQIRLLNLAVPSRNVAESQDHTSKPNDSRIKSNDESNHKVTLDFKSNSSIEPKTSNKAGSSVGRNRHEISVSSYSSQDQSYNYSLESQTSSNMIYQEPVYAWHMPVNSQQLDNQLRQQQQHQQQRQPGYFLHQRHSNYGQMSHYAPRIVCNPMNTPNNEITSDIRENGSSNIEPEIQKPFPNYDHYMKARIVRPGYMTIGGQFADALSNLQPQYEPSASHKLPSYSNFFSSLL